MDAADFDRLTRDFARTGTRRRLLRLLAAVPVVSLPLTAPPFAALFGEEAEAAKGQKQKPGTQRQHRTDGHQQVGADKKKKKKCAPAGQATSKKRKRCCPGLVKTGAICTRPGPPPAPPCNGLKPTGSSPTQGLQEAIEAAPAGSTLTLCAGTWNLTATVVIFEELTLVGAGAGQTILNGQGQVQVLVTARAPAPGEPGVQLRDLTISNGRGDKGGGIHNLGLLTLAGVSITGNTATNSGGGIYNSFGTVILGAGSVIGGNTPAEANTARIGGGIFNSVAGTVTLQDGSRVTGNIDTINGGGIDNAGTLTVAAQALVCNNTPFDTPNLQCTGLGPVTGNCPNPADGICPS